MSVYFNYFPDIIYDKNKIKNISKKVAFMENVSEEFFLPLTLKDGEKPEDIAYFYYGDVSYTPFVLMANKCYDWNYDWLMTENKLHMYIYDKYKNISGLKNVGLVVDWSKNVNLIENIVYFIDNNGNKYSTDTFIINNVPSNQISLKDTKQGQKILLDSYLASSNLKPVRVYDYEFENNENKRTIYVIDKKYIKDVVSIFKEKIVE